MYHISAVSGKNLEEIIKKALNILPSPFSVTDLRFCKETFEKAREEFGESLFISYYDGDGLSWFVKSKVLVKEDPSTVFKEPHILLRTSEGEIEVQYNLEEVSNKPTKTLDNILDSPDLTNL